MIYSMGKPVGVKQAVVKQAVAKQSVVKQTVVKQDSVTPPPPRKAVRQCELSAEERRRAEIYGRLPFSFSKNWDARLEPPA
ncbi:MAG: hypothetical protein ACK5WG_13365 [Betaproteobacteria bacterium]|jgi:hypothetical protein